MSESEKKQLTMDEDTSIIEEQNVSKGSFSKRKCIWISVFLIVITICTVPLLYVIYQGDHVETDVSATLMTRRGSHNSRTCDDFDYGCCEIYYGCSVKNDIMNYETEHISPYRRIAADIMKTNCPTLRQLVHEYNEHYKKDDCGKYGCCPPVPDRCDKTIQNMKNIGNNENLVEIFIQNKNNREDILVPKDNPHGSNCWNNNPMKDRMFVYLYNHRWPSKDDDTTTVLIILMLCVCFLISLR